MKNDDFTILRNPCLHARFCLITTIPVCPGCRVRVRVVWSRVRFLAVSSPFLVRHAPSRPRGFEGFTRENLAADYESGIPSKRLRHCHPKYSYHHSIPVPVKILTVSNLLKSSTPLRSLIQDHLHFLSTD